MSDNPKNFIINMYLEEIKGPYHKYIFINSFKTLTMALHMIESFSKNTYFLDFTFVILTENILKTGEWINENDIKKSAIQKFINK